MCFDEKLSKPFDVVEQKELYELVKTWRRIEEVKDIVGPVNLCKTFDYRIEEKTAKFLGRETILHSMEVWCKANDASKPLICLILGSPGTGKSSFVARSIQHFFNRVIAYHICERGVPDTLDSTLFVRNLYMMLLDHPTIGSKFARAIKCLSSKKLDYLANLKSKAAGVNAKDCMMIILDVLKDEKSLGRSAFTDVDEGC